MHGHKRSEYKARLLDPKVAAGMQHKANQWFKLNDQVLSFPSLSAPIAKTAQDDSIDPSGLDSSFTEESKQPTSRTINHLELISNMLQVNPDPLYLWQRRRLLLLQLPEFSHGNDRGSVDTLHENSLFEQYISDERALTRKCLERNPKAYGAWFHRKWTIMQVVIKTKATSTVSLTSSSSSSLLEQELELTALFLNLDERNFHCWSFRRFIVACLCGSAHGEIILQGQDDAVLFGSQLGRGGHLAITKSQQEQIHDDKSTCLIPMSEILPLLRKEFDFTRAKIRQNFSNASAFHYRSKLLPHILLEIASKNNNDDNDEASSILAQELDLVHNAMFTEPDDQTAWWYYDFLLTEYATRNDENRVGGIDLKEEQSLLEELIEAENNQSKWAMLGLYHVLSLCRKMEVDMNEHEKQQYEDRQIEILTTLQSLDPVRQVRYRDMLKAHNPGLGH